MDFGPVLLFSLSDDRGVSVMYTEFIHFFLPHSGETFREFLLSPTVEVAIEFRGIL
jgi:hypothetical protein